MWDEELAWRDGLIVQREAEWWRQSRFCRRLLRTSSCPHLWRRVRSRPDLSPTLIQSLAGVLTEQQSLSRSSRDERGSWCSFLLRADVRAGVDRAPGWTFESIVNHNTACAVARGVWVVREPARDDNARVERFRHRGNEPSDSFDVLLPRCVFPHDGVYTVCPYDVIRWRNVYSRLLRRLHLGITHDHGRHVINFLSDTLRKEGTQ